MNEGGRVTVIERMVSLSRLVWEVGDVRQRNSLHSSGNAVKVDEVMWQEKGNMLRT